MKTEALCGDGADDAAFHDLGPELRYSWDRVGILPGKAMARLLMDDLDCHERKGRLAERMGELEAHGSSLQEYRCECGRGKLVELPLTRRWLEEFRRRRTAEAGKQAKATEAEK